MNKSTYTLCLLLIFLQAGNNVCSQDITTRDSKEIKLLAKRKVEKSLNDLLNFLTLEDLTESDRATVIEKNIADTIQTRLFYNKDIIIEDDLQPERAIDQIVDLKVGKYLVNLDLLYSKSIESTINFSDVTVSEVKEKVYPYVKVYYTQQFKGKSNQSTVSFKAVPRVAEVRAERSGKKWLVRIAQIGYVKPGDSPENPINNVKLIEPDPALDSATIREREEQEQIQESMREKEREQERLSRQVYESYLQKGDKALATKDFEGALLAYREAEIQNKSSEEILHKAKIAQVKRLIDASKIAESEILKGYKEKADLARKKRQYSEALSLYHKILEKFPDSTAIRTVVIELTQKASTKTEYDERFTAGQYSQLRRAYDDIIKKEKNNSDWYLGRGKTYVKLDEDDKALRDLNKSIELDYSNLEALQARAELYQRRNNLPKSIADYSSYLIIDPTNDKLFWQRGLLRLRTNNLSSAEDDFSQAIKLDGTQGQYHFDRGLLLLKNQKLENALSDFSNAIQTTPQMADAYFWRGMIYATKKQYSETGKDFRSALAHRISNAYVIRIDSVIQSLYKLGKKANEEQKFSQAVHFLTDALLINVSFQQALYERGISNFKIKKYDEAIKDLTLSALIDSTQYTTYDRRAEVYVALKEFNKAAADYHSSNRLNSLNYSSMLGEASALAELKKYAEAIPSLLSIKIAYKKISKIFPPVFFRDVYHLLGVCEFETGQFEKAIDDYSDAINLDEKFTEAYFNRGKSYESLNKLDRAISDYQTACTQKPNEASWQITMAQAVEKKGDYLQAIHLYTNVLKSDTAKYFRSTSLYRRGLNSLAAQKYPDALSDLDQPIVQADTSVCKQECWLQTGIANIFNGKPDAGISYLSKCLNDPRYLGKASYAIACANLLKEDKAAALGWFEKAFQTNMGTSDLRKDKLIDASKKDFRKDKDFQALLKKYKK